MASFIYTDLASVQEIEAFKTNLLISDPVKLIKARLQFKLTDYALNGVKLKPF